MLVAPQEAQHAARLVAVHSALLSLLLEQTPELAPDGVTAAFHWSEEEGVSLSISYSRDGMVVGEEGI